MIVPKPERWTAGEEVDADTLNARASEILEFLLEPPQAGAKQTVAQNLSTGTKTKINLDTTLKDNDGIVNLSTDRLTIQTPGWYDINFGVGFAAGSTLALSQKVRRIAGVTVNGSSSFLGRRDTLPCADSIRSCRTGGAMTTAFLNTGDYVELWGYQDSGGTIATYVSEVNAQPFIQILWVSN